MSEVRVIESDSIWERLKATISKPGYIIGVVVGILLLAIIIAVVVVVTSRDSASDEVVDYSKALIVSNDRGLYALDLNSQKQTVLTRTSKGIAAFGLHKKNTIYWREIDSQWINSLSSKYHNLTQTRTWDPRAVAVDSITENVYALDAYAGILNVFDPKSTSYGIAVSDLKRPIDMALDPLRGLVFIVQDLDSVLKCNMDGTSPEEIIKSPSITAIAVDTQTPKLYWADSVNIQSSDYVGDQRQIVARISNIVPGLGVSGNRLFWTKQPDPISLRTLWTCTMSSGVCNENGIQNIPFDDPKSIKIYTGQETGINNPCENGNGGCKHLCLRSTNNGHSVCACFIGHRLEDDGKSCAPVTDFVLYTRGDFIRGRILDSDRQAFSDSMPPIRFHQKALNEKRSIDFDYNFYTNTFAFSDDQSINTVNMLKEEPQGIYARDKCLKYVSFDWITNDIYYVRDNCYTGPKNAIAVLKPREDKYLFKTLNTFSPNQGHPISLAVHPNKGCHFFTMLLDGEAQIYRVRGLKITPFSNEFSNNKLSINETGLAIDFVEDRLYWFSQSTTELHNANLEGEDVKSIDVSVVREPRSISIHGRYAYIANLTSVWRFDKVSGRGATRLAPRSSDDEKEVIAGVRIFSQNVQRISADNFCAIQNGDCQQFCFQRPKIIGGGNAVNVTEEIMKICLCDDFQTIQIDGTCV